MGVPRSNQVIGIDGLDETGFICVPLGDGVRVAARRSANTRVATRVVGQLPGHDGRLIGVARDDKLNKLVELRPDVHISVKLVMRLIYTKLLNVKVHTAYVKFGQEKVPTTRKHWEITEVIRKEVAR